MDESENFDELFKSSKKAEKEEKIESEKKEPKIKKKTTKKESDTEGDDTTTNKDDDKVKKKRKPEGAKKQKKAVDAIAEEANSQTAKSTSKLKVTGEENPVKKRKKKAEDGGGKKEKSKEVTQEETSVPKSQNNIEVEHTQEEIEGKNKKIKKDSGEDTLVKDLLASKISEKDSSQILAKTLTPTPIPKEEGVENILKSLSLQDDVEETIMRYMIIANRPYSVNDIFNNHHGRIKKKQLEQTLNNLTEKNLLIGKKYNTCVYLVSQNLFPPVSEVQLKSINKEIEEIEENLKTQKANQQKLQQTLKQVKAVLSEEEISKKIQDKQEEIVAIKKKLDIYKNTKFEKIPEEVIDKLLSDYEQRYKKFKTIRKTMNNVIDTLSEGMEISTKEFYNKYNLDSIKETEEKLKINLK